MENWGAFDVVNCSSVDVAAVPFAALSHTHTMDCQQHEKGNEGNK